LENGRPSIGASSEEKKGATGRHGSIKQMENERRYKATLLSTWKNLKTELPKAILKGEKRSWGHTAKFTVRKKRFGGGWGKEEMVTKGETSCS